MAGGGPKAMPIEECRERAYLRGYTLLDASRPKAKDKMRFECPQGHLFAMTWSNFHGLGMNCPVCKGERTAARCRRPYDGVAQLLAEKGLELLTSREDYEQNHHRQGISVTYRCRARGHEGVVKGPWIGRQGCARCSVEARGQGLRVPMARVVEAARAVGLELDATSYSSNKKKLAARCPVHGPVSTTYNSMQQGMGCAKCSRARFGAARRVPPEAVARLVAERGGTLLSGEVLGRKAKVKIRCQKGHEFLCDWNHLSSSNAWCPRCQRKASRQQLEIKGYIESLGAECTLNGREVLGGKEIDVWVPSARLAIEVDGLYWHSERVRPKAARDNMAKVAAARKAGIRLLCIFEDEWRDKRRLVESMVASRLGRATEQLQARKLRLASVPKPETKTFMENNHLDGHAQFSEAFGLYDGDRLVACMTLRTDRRGRREVARLATLPWTSVAGGASRLLASVEGPLVSYSSNRVGDGLVYARAGFREETLCQEPSYWYTDFRRRVWRFRCRKDGALPGTEREQALAGAFRRHFGHARPVYRVYDYGHRRWVRS